ncbi:hypothetical protein N7481_010388 [Penicillium waksmanii]|uniref:uncharacterized protein n=1 Tax=Penicillium waksmanii TaxID=69791 RepID=UPI0025494C5F|nr:uncharacterized protein N7481_010388 [Penicillium waksmanii]KAJ5973178.1 hypothetical protein N7481_010388 [Penicillium waksmanii]
MKLLGGGGLLMLVLAVDNAMSMCNTLQTQVNLTMCNWQGLRELSRLTAVANVLHDTVYLDGGSLWLQQGYDDGCANHINDGNFNGYIYYLNLSTPFNISSDFMTVLSNKTIAGGAASNIAPNYIDGVMFSNDDEFYLYGGMARATNVTDTPAGDVVLGYEAYQYNSDAQMWAPKWYSDNLPSDVTRYITNGAGTSAPSENMGFYFSGMRAPDWGAFTFDDMKSNSTANTLITVNMSKMGKGKWANNSLPDSVSGRSKAELVWLPVSKSGVLVAIGGVVKPVDFWRTTGLSDSQISKSKEISPTFMETVSVYDVESKTWYLQNTTGEIPPQLTQFCSVLASSSDDSSHNIYIYGGYDGLKYNSNPSDDVYILSIPSFKWIKAYNGSSTHSRSGHRCVKVYPDQMLILGGQHVASSNCLEDGVIVNFNLNKLEFQDSYDPTKWDGYQVPQLVTSQIGGDSSGGATTTSPFYWTNSTLGDVFQTKYSKPIATYWPYGISETSGSQKASGGLPSWAPPVIGVLCGLFGIALLIAGVLMCCCRRRRSQRPLIVSKTAKDMESTEDRKLMYAGGPASPRPGPASNSTGVETGANVSTMQDSIDTSVSPRTVESGGGCNSSPAELPTHFNTMSSASTTTPPLGPLHGCDSPVSPHSPTGSDSGQSYQHVHHRSPSSLSNVPSLSIDDVVTGRTSYFHESFDHHSSQRARHGSEISDASISSDERGRFGGNETIQEAD